MATWYVATDGHDPVPGVDALCDEHEPQPGSESKPFQTVSYGVSQLHPGDTLYLRGGTYTGEANTIDSERFTVPSGTDGARCYIVGYPHEPVTIQPPPGHHGLRLTNGAPAYLVFQDVTLDLCQHAGGAVASAPNAIYLSSGAHHNRFERVECKNGLNFGVVFSEHNANSPFNQVVHCDIHHFGVPGGSAIEGHGAYISTSDNLFEGNEIHDNEGYGLHLYDDAEPMIVSRNVIRGNNIHDNGHGGTAYGILVAWGDANEVYDNHVHHNPGGISVYTNASHTHVHHNMITDNTPLEGVFIQYATGTVVEKNQITGNTTAIADYAADTQLIDNQT